MVDIPSIQEEIQRAVDFAVRSHAGQFRKGGLPYICHPMGVLAQLSEWEITNVVTWKAAICHDILEDCGVGLEELVEEIGEEAALVVEELSFFPDKADEVLSPKDQKEQYMASFGDKSVHALTTKVADRFCNVCDFLAVDSSYAKIYWEKASELFLTMISRREEIALFYESEVIFPRMRYSQTQLAQMMNF